MKLLIKTIYDKAKIQDDDIDDDEDGSRKDNSEKKENYDEGEIEDLEDKYDKDVLITLLLKFIEGKKNFDSNLNTADQNKKKQIDKDKKEKSQLAEKKYWENLTKVLPEETEQVWRVMDKIGSKYYQLLLDRHKLIEETTELHNQNDELQNLLNQY